MVVFPNAKINLGLNVVSRRSDGYHNISSVFYPVPVCDALEVQALPAHIQSDDFQLSGVEIPGHSHDNLCLKALQVMRGQFHIPPLGIHLHKAIPTGAGLGGGSADAGFLLSALNAYFGLGLSGAPLRQMSLELGSDCAFFIENKPAYVTGRGEEIEIIEPVLKGKTIVVIFSNIHVATANAYSRIKIKPVAVDVKDVVLHKPIDVWRDFLTNDFEGVVFEEYPELKTVKENLYRAGALYASMTGSGSAVYGIFDFAPNLSAYFPEGNYSMGEL